MPAHGAEPALVTAPRVVIALSVFVPFAVCYMRERLTLDYLWAACCLAGAAFFMFRGK